MKTVWQILQIITTCSLTKSFTLVLQVNMWQTLNRLNAAGLSVSAPAAGCWLITGDRPSFLFIYILVFKWLWLNKEDILVWLWIQILLFSVWAQFLFLVISLIRKFCCGQKHPFELFDISQVMLTSETNLVDICVLYISWLSTFGLALWRS